MIRAPTDVGPRGLGEVVRATPSRSHTTKSRPARRPGAGARAGRTGRTARSPLLRVEPRAAQKREPKSVLCRLPRDPRPRDTLREPDRVRKIFGELLEVLNHQRHGATAFSANGSGAYPPRGSPTASRSARWIGAKIIMLDWPPGPASTTPTIAPCLTDTTPDPLLPPALKILAP